MSDPSGPFKTRFPENISRIKPPSFEALGVSMQRTVAEVSSPRPAGGAATEGFNIQIASGRLIEQVAAHPKGREIRSLSRLHTYRS
jgi:hypothetical protein